jgi:hypothetical protein
LSDVPLWSELGESENHRQILEIGTDPHARKSEFVHERERLGSLDAIEKLNARGFS